MAGKGDKRRKGANSKAYAAGWDRIFGNKDKPNGNEKQVRKADGSSN